MVELESIGTDQDSSGLGVEATGSDAVNWGRSWD